jgi:hypothetical protein
MSGIDRRLASALVVQLGTWRARVRRRFAPERGERLRSGGRLITGSVVQVPLQPGDEVLADLGALGRVQLSMAR